MSSIHLLRFEIRRENNQRVVKIFGNIAKGYSLTDVITKSQNLNKFIKFPEGYSFEFVGQQKDFKDLVTQMIIA